MRTVTLLSCHYAHLSAKSGESDVTVTFRLRHFSDRPAYAEPMADLFNNLPLSNKVRHDESHVTSDRRIALADTVDQAAVWLAEASITEDLRSDLARTFLSDARITAVNLQDSSPGTVSMLAQCAAQLRTGKKQSIRALSHALRALLLLGIALDRSSVVPPLTSGSVALYAATTASFERRAVISGHSIRATDADWSFGHGPVLEGTALGVVAFLLGVSDAPPVAPPPREHPPHERADH